jgi:hypothetical protein
VIAQQRGITRDQATKQITSLFRANSEAHKRGAFDLSIRNSKNVGAEAAAIRDSLGKGFMVIHEQPSADKKSQTNTFYHDDGTSKTVTMPHGTKGFAADGPHIHVQPSKELLDKK